MKKLGQCFNNYCFIGAFQRLTTKTQTFAVFGTVIPNELTLWSADLELISFKC